MLNFFQDLSEEAATISKKVTDSLNRFTTPPPAAAPVKNAEPPARWLDLASDTPAPPSAGFSIPDAVKNAIPNLKKKAIDTARKVISAATPFFDPEAEKVSYDRMSVPDAQRLTGVYLGEAQDIVNAAKNSPAVPTKLLNSFQKDIQTHQSGIDKPSPYEAARFAYAVRSTLLDPKYKVSLPSQSNTTPNQFFSSSQDQQPQIYGAGIVENFQAGASKSDFRPKQGPVQKPLEGPIQQQVGPQTFEENKQALEKDAYQKGEAIAKGEVKMKNVPPEDLDALGRPKNWKSMTLKERWTFLNSPEHQARISGEFQDATANTPGQEIGQNIRNRFKATGQIAQKIDGATSEFADWLEKEGMGNPTQLFSPAQIVRIGGGIVTKPFEAFGHAAEAIDAGRPVVGASQALFGGVIGLTGVGAIFNAFDSVPATKKLMDGAFEKYGEVKQAVRDTDTYKGLRDKLSSVTGIKAVNFDDAFDLLADLAAFKIAHEVVTSLPEGKIPFADTAKSIGQRVADYANTANIKVGREEVYNAWQEIDGRPSGARPEVVQAVRDLFNNGSKAVSEALKYGMNVKVPRQFLPELREKIATAMANTWETAKTLKTDQRGSFDPFFGMADNFLERRAAKLKAEEGAVPGSSEPLQLPSGKREQNAEKRNLQVQADSLRQEAQKNPEKAAELNQKADEIEAQILPVRGKVPEKIPEAQNGPKEFSVEETTPDGKKSGEVKTVKFVETKSGDPAKNRVEEYNSKGDLLNTTFQAEAEKKYETNDPETLAKRIVNPHDGYDYQTEKYTAPSAETGNPVSEKSPDRTQLTIEGKGVSQGEIQKQKETQAQRDELSKLQAEKSGAIQGGYVETGQGRMFDGGAGEQPSFYDEPSLESQNQQSEQSVQKPRNLPLEARSAELRDSVVTSRKLHNEGEPNAGQVLNSDETHLEEFHKKNKEVTLEVAGNYDIKPTARVEVVKYSDGKYQSRYMLDAAGFKSDTEFFGEFDTKEDAVANARANLLDEVNRELETNTNKEQRKKLEKVKQVALEDKRKDLQTQMEMAEKGPDNVTYNPDVFTEEEIQYMKENKLTQKEVDATEEIRRRQVQEEETRLAMDYMKQEFPDNEGLEQAFEEVTAANRGMKPKNVEEFVTGWEYLKNAKEYDKTATPEHLATARGYALQLSKLRGRGSLILAGKPGRFDEVIETKDPQSIINILKKRIDEAKGNPSETLLQLKDLFDKIENGVLANDGETDANDLYQAIVEELQKIPKGKPTEYVSKQRKTREGIVADLGGRIREKTGREEIKPGTTNSAPRSIADRVRSVAASEAGQHFFGGLRELDRVTNIFKNEKVFENVKKQIREATGQIQKTSFYFDDEGNFMEFSARDLSGFYKDIEREQLQREREAAAAPIVELPPLKDLKDLKISQNARLDPERIFERVFGKDSPVTEEMLGGLQKSKDQYFDFLKHWGERLQNEIVDEYNIKRKSRASALVQLLGEKEISFDQVMKEVGFKRAQDIRKAAQWFRNRYDELIDQVNAARKEIYGNNPEKLIPKRQKYFRHFQEFTGFSGLKNIFMKDHAISPDLVGISETTQPKTKWLSIAQKRTGPGTDIDAIGGFINYLEPAGYSIHIDKNIQRFRKLRADLVNALAETDHPTQLNRFLDFLNDYSNDLAGKTNPYFDRDLQKLTDRKVVKVLDWINSRTKLNTILGNISSSMAQFFNIPQGLAFAKEHSVQGAKDTLLQIFSENENMKKSIFIKERFSEPLKAKFNTNFMTVNAFGINREFEISWMGKPKEFAGWLVQVGDEIGTKFIWNSIYRKAVAEGVKDPIAYADKNTKKMVAGRGIGEMPIIQKSKVTQLIAPFQLEVANTWHVLGDTIKGRDLTGLGIFIVASYLMNAIVRKIRGSDVSLDFVNAVAEGLDNTKKDDNFGIKSLRVAGRVFGEIFSNFPLGQEIAAILPEQGNSVLPARKEIFGSGDPTRFGAGILASKSLADPFFSLVMPWGGKQLERTLAGLGADLQGGIRKTDTANPAPFLNRFLLDQDQGKLQAPIETSWEKLQSLLFGKYSGAKAEDYLANLNKKVEDRKYNTPEVQFLMGADLQRYLGWKQLDTEQKQEFAKELTDSQKKDVQKWIYAEKNPKADLYDLQDKFGVKGTTSASLYAHKVKVKLLNGTDPKTIPPRPKGWQEGDPVVTVNNKKALDIFNDEHFKSLDDSEKSDFLKNLRDEGQISKTDIFDLRILNGTVEMIDILDEIDNRKNAVKQ